MVRVRLRRLAAALLLMCVLWALPATADASCGDWLAEHAAAGSRGGTEINGESHPQHPDSGAPVPPCHGLRCAPHAPAPAPPAPLPSVSTDQWAWQDAAAAPPAGETLPWSEPVALNRSEFRGADIFRPPR